MIEMYIESVISQRDDKINFLCSLIAKIEGIRERERIVKGHDH